MITEKNNRIIIFLIMTLLGLQSCSLFDRDFPVEKKGLVGSDYRLFQNTPAWELAKAVQDGDEQEIKEILKVDPNLINFQDSVYGSTLLMMTIMNQQMKSFKILLGLKADISIHDTYSGRSALIEACYYRHYNLKYVELLLQNGANPNDVETGEKKKGSSTRDTPLIVASRAGRLDFML